MSKEKEYIYSFNLNGGAKWGIKDDGLYYIGYIAREQKIKILFANIKLYFMWLFKK